MTAVRFNANVGLKRLVGPNSSQRGFTQSIRQSMQEIIKEYKRWILHMEIQTPEVLLDALRPTFEKSQILVPVKSGDLKGSGYLEKSTFRGNPQVEIGYGRGGVPHYAVFVHERTDLHHDGPTQAKFLQQPLEEDFQDIQTRIVQGLKRAAGV